jgi:Protein of unknown function (DUF3011)
LHFFTPKSAAVSNQVPGILHLDVQFRPYAISLAPFWRITFHHRQLSSPTPKTLNATNSVRRLCHEGKRTFPTVGQPVSGSFADTHRIGANELSRPAPAATGGPSLTCESRNNKRNYCAADTRGGVTLGRQPSQAQCVQGRTWGFDARGIWVEGGCRAEFQVNAYNGAPNWGNPGYGHRPPMPGGPNWGKNAGACFYKEINYAGEYFCMRRGESYPNLPPGYNDRISSINSCMAPKSPSTTTPILAGGEARRDETWQI